MSIYLLFKMKKLLLSAVLVSVISFSIMSCENKKSTLKVTADISILNDSNYVYKNISTTKGLHFADKKSKIDSTISIKYSDSTYKTPLKLLSDNQRALLLAPFLAPGYGIDYAIDEMWGHFVSKQNKIGALQPIIVAVGGIHDYSALRLIVLNENGKAISCLDLDETVSFPRDNIPFHHYESESYSLLNKNEITTYRVSKFYYPNKPSIKNVVVDSAVFKSVIDLKGKISTKQVVKIHYTKDLNTVKK